MPSRSYSSSYTSKDSNRDSSGKSKSHHHRNVRLEEQNNNYRHNYLPFIIPSSFYNIVHVHRFTTIDTISTLINHFESCYRYSIDTESDRFTYELSLIQVHSIPQNLPSFIVLFEINHLPPSDTFLFGKIKLLFRLLFRLGNIIFSWGSMSDELKSAVRMNLFTWPSLALLINLQDKFPSWYRGAQPSYPNYSPLSSHEQHKRINYATSDCFAVTLLHQAIYDEWSLTQLREADLTSLFTWNAPPHSSSLSSSTLLKNVSEYKNETKPTSASISNAPRHSSLPLSSLLENITDEENEEEEDEIFVSSLSRHYDTNTLINSTRHVEIEPAIVSGVVTIEPAPLNQQLSANEPPQSRRNCRSSSARTRRNHKRNMVKRLHRDQHLILRKVYHRFNLHQIKNILRNRDVQYVHLKLDKSSQVLSIGMKKSSLVDLYFDRLPGDLFDKEHYQHYR
ncbi:unnamed protein product, partial [Rotaria sp. Silwood2]